MSKNKLPEHFVNTVEGYTDLNMLEEATEECLRMVQRDPDNAELLVYSAGKASMGTSAQIQRLMEPIQLYLEAHPDDFQVRQAHAALLAVEKRYDESLAEFARVPPEKRRYDANWLWFRTLMDSGRKGEVNAWIKNVWPGYSHKVRSAEFSTYIKFLWDVSACQIEAGELEQAKAGYKFILQSDPGALGAYLDYGKLLARLNRKEEAIEVLRRGLGLTSKQVDQQHSYPGVIGYCPHERRRIDHEIKEELAKLEPQKERH